MTQPRQAGFTLLELLVALAIFALVSVMAYGGLGTVLELQFATEENAERLAVLQKTYMVMQRDFEQVVPRAVRDDFGDSQPPLMSGTQLQLTRGGWSNPAGRPRSSLRRVGYRVEEQQLIRYAWAVLDRAQNSEPIRQPLLDDVTEISIRFLSGGNNWKDQWPSTTITATGAEPHFSLPRVIEIKLEHERFGPITWLFSMPI